MDYDQGINLLMRYNEYPLKITNNLEIDQIFQGYITRTLGGEIAWRSVCRVFEDISKLRKELISDQNNIYSTNQNEQSDKIIIKLLKYYQYLLFLEQKFRFENYQQGSVEILFEWSNSFNSQKKLTCPSLVFEKSCILYNLAILYNGQGVYLMNQNNQNDRKVSTQKFRFGLWCVSQIKNLTMNISQDLKVIHSDLGENNLDILYHSMLGNCYGALFSNLLPDELKVKVNNIASLAGEASYNFTIALSKANALIQAADNFIPQDHLLKVKATLFFGAVRFLSLSGIKMAKWHQGEQEDDIKGQHIGWALGYIKNSLASLQKAFGNEAVMKVLDKDQRTELEAIKKEVETQYSKLNQRNEQIYNHKIPEDKTIPRTQLDNRLIIQPVEPKELSGKLDINHQNFANFMNEDIANLIVQIKDFGQKKCNEVEVAQKQIMDMKNTAYLENFVNFFLDLVGNNSLFQSQTFPPKVAEKINKINQQGGMQQLQQQVQNLKGSNQQCGQILQNIKQAIEQEQQEDESFKSQYNFKWTRTPSKDTNKDYLGELKNLQDNFKIACDIEVENQSKWSKNQSIVTLLSQSTTEQLKVLGTNSADQEFKVKNQKNLSQLEQVNNEINQFISSIKDCVNQINFMIRNINYQDKVTKALQDKIPMDKVMETILSPVSLQTTALNGIIANFSIKVSEACTISIELQQQRNQRNNGNMEKQEEISNGLNQLAGLFEDCKNGMKFYQDLTSYSIELQKKVGDFVKARDIEKNNLLQMINNEIQKGLFQQGGFGQFPVFSQVSQQFSQSQQFMDPYAPNPNASQQFQHQNQGYQANNLPQQQPFYFNGDFNQGSSVFIPRK